MTWITKDKRVQKIIKDHNQTNLSRASARAAIEGLAVEAEPGYLGNNHYLPWEVDEAMKEIQ